jgi:hypothetical protein
VPTAGDLLAGNLRRHAGELAGICMLAIQRGPCRRSHCICRNFAQN